MTTNTSRPRSKGFNQTIQLILAVLVGVALGTMSLVLSPLWTMVGVIGIAVLLVAIKWPELSILAVIAALCTVLPEARMPVIEIGPGRLYMTEPIMIGLYLVLIIRWLVERDFRLVRTPTDLPLILFYIWAIGTTLVAIINQTVDSTSYIPEIRMVSYYLIFFLVTNLVRKKGQVETLINGMFFMATIVSVAMIYQYTLGTSVLFLSGRVEVLETAGTVNANITRITDQAGEGILTLAFMLKSVMLMTKSLKVQRVPTLVQWCLFAVAMVMSFNRTWWVVSVLVVMVTAILVQGEMKRRLVKWALIFAYIIPLAGIPLLMMPDTRAGGLVGAALQRVGSVLTVEAYSEGSTTSTVRWRDFEYTYGLQNIQEHPIGGLGLGALYRPLVFGVDDEWFDGRGYSHNGHLWISSKTGLVGYSLFMWFMFLAIFRGFSRWRKIKDPDLSSFVLGVTLALAGMVLGSNLHPVYMTLYWIPLIGMLIGMNETIYRVEELA